MGLDALLAHARAPALRPLLRLILAVAALLALATVAGARWLHLPPPAVMLTWAAITLAVAVLIALRLPERRRCSAAVS